eukprot:jgi/Bigna1/90449/estExt_fgenesh1_pg.C_710003
MAVSAASFASYLDHCDVISSKRVCKSWYKTLRVHHGFTNLNFEGKTGVAKLLERFGKHPGSENTRHISLRFCAELENKDLELLAQFRNLKSVNLDYCQKVSDDGINTLLSNFKDLDHLSLFWMPWLTSKTTQYLQGLQSIKSLNLSGVMHLSDNDVADVVRKAGRELRSIDLSRVKAVNEKTLKAIGTTCTHLHTLRMYACEAFSASALSHIGKVCAQLQILDICGSKYVDDECIEKLARGCPRLERLNLQWCVLVTDRSLVALASCRKLTSLSLHGNKNVTDRHGSPFKGVQGNARFGYKWMHRDAKPYIRAHSVSVFSKISRTCGTLIEKSRSTDELP